jgi:hypothetical protein
MSPFDYLNSINDTKQNLMVDDITEKQYNAFMVNRGLSYFPDTVAVANEMNMYAHLDKKLQYHFLLNIIRKRKRFSKWTKVDKSADLDAVKEYYGYSEEKARSAMQLLSRDQLDIIKQKISKGGKSK